MAIEGGHFYQEFNLASYRYAYQLHRRARPSECLKTNKDLEATNKLYTFNVDIKSLWRVIIIIIALYLLAFFIMLIEVLVEKNQKIMKNNFEVPDCISQD